MLETSARLLRLLGLLQSQRDWSGNELSDRLGVSPRTVRRDVEKLRLLGYPVNAVGGVGGGYRLGAGASLPPLLLEDDEAIAVAVALRTAAGGTVTGIAETAVRALGKLDQVLPSRLRHQVTTLSTALVALPSSRATIDPSVLTVIASAVRDRLRLRFDYTSYEGPTSLRDVEPYQLINDAQRWYLFAWDIQRDDWRRFRLDRLEIRVPPGPRFSPRSLPADDLADFFSTGSKTARFRYEAVLMMHGPATEVADEVPPTLGTVEPVSDEKCLLRMGSNNLDHLAVWTATFGFEFEVVEPPELRERLRDLTARLQRSVSPEEHPSR